MPDRALELVRGDTLARRLPFYYGYVILPVAIITQLATSPGQSYAVSAFTGPILDDLQLSQSQFTGAYGLATLLGSLPLAYFGTLSDRFGIRRCLLLIVTALTLVCLAMSQVRGLVTLFIGFLFLRMLGQGAMTILATNMLPMWFDRQLGRLMGFKALAMPIGTATVPVLLAVTIAQFGWRSAYVMMGLLVLAVMLPLIVLVYRNRPNDVGQRVDGVVELFDDDKKPEANVGEPSGVTSEEPSGGGGVVWGLNLKQAVRTRAFWIVACNDMLPALVLTGIFITLGPLVELKGLTEEAFKAAYIVTAIGMVFTMMVGGYFADRLKLNWMLPLIPLGFASTVGVLMIADDMVDIYIFAALQGLTIGWQFVVSGTLWPRYFGTKHLGQIRGSTHTIMVAASAAGPFIMGLCFDWSGSYDVSLLIFLSMFLPLIVLTPFATRPARPPLEEDSTLHA